MRQLLIWFTAALLFCLLMAPFVRGQERVQPGTPLSWKISVATLSTASAADAIVSTDLSHNLAVHEANPIAGGNRMIAVKSASTAGAVLTEWLLARHHPERYKYWTWLNYGLAGMFAGVTIHNVRLAH
jgi:hypothetical protein